MKKAILVLIVVVVFLFIGSVNNLANKRDTYNLTTTDRYLLQSTFDSDLTIGNAEGVSENEYYQDDFENQSSESLNKLSDLFAAHKTGLVYVAEMLANLTDEQVVIVYDNINDCISEIFVNNVSADVNCIFSDNDQEVLLYCFDAMSQIVPENTKLEIKKWSPYSFQCIDFRFNTQNLSSLNWGIVYSKDDILLMGYDECIGLNENWYSFVHFEKHCQEVVM